MKRRDCFQLIGVTAAAGASALASGGCGRDTVRKHLPLRHKRGGTAATVTTLPPTGEISRVVRLLHRAGFGPAPGDVALVTDAGLEAYIDEQLAAPADDRDDAPGLRFRVRSADTLHVSAAELRDLPEHEILRQLQKVAILRAVYSKWQLRERMVDFWSNHFNVYARKGFGTYLKGEDDMDVIRAHALGKFPDLLRASAKSPAMLGYLDNQINRKGVANENYAREIMELHTLGVGGGYTQKDVQEVARCLTGWTVEDRFLRPRGKFRFDPDRHDEGAKMVLGSPIPAGAGIDDGEMVLDILAKHPSTARFISRKLVRYFLGTEDEAWVTRLAAIYTETDGDIQTMLRPLLLADDLLSAPPILKRPFDFVVSALRVTDADTDGGTGVQEHLSEMGQPLFQWPMPDGYPDRTSAWTGSVLARWNFAAALVSGRVKGTALDVEALKASGDALTDSLMECLLARRPDDPALGDTRAALLTHQPETPESHAAEITALLLASPVFQWR